MIRQLQTLKLKYKSLNQEQSKVPFKKKNSKIHVRVLKKIKTHIPINTHIYTLQAKASLKNPLPLSKLKKHNTSIEIQASQNPLTAMLRRNP